LAKKIWFVGVFLYYFLFVLSPQGKHFFKFLFKYMWGVNSEKDNLFLWCLRKLMPSPRLPGKLWEKRRKLEVLHKIKDIFFFMKVNPTCEEKLDQLDEIWKERLAE